VNTERTHSPRANHKSSSSSSSSGGGGGSLSYHPAILYAIPVYAKTTSAKSDTLVTKLRFTWANERTNALRAFDTGHKCQIAILIEQSHGRTEDARRGSRHRDIDEGVRNGLRGSKLNQVERLSTQASSRHHILQGDYL
jgi:hypothetical protein